MVSNGCTSGRLQLSRRMVAKTSGRVMGRRSIATLALGAITLAACGTAASAASSTTSTAKSSRTSSLVLPNLKGETINLAKAADTALVEDTVSYIVSQELKKWGAHSSLILTTSTPGAAALLAGSIQGLGGSLAAALNAGLVVIGPSQARLDYVIIATPKITKFSQLSGQPFPISNVGGNEQGVIAAAMDEAHLSEHPVNYVVSGGDSASLSEFVAGREQAVVAHVNTLPSLRADHVKFHILATSAEVAPWALDSVEMVTKPWLNGHKKAAEAMDLAWLYAAHIYSTDKPLFVKYAMAYTQGTETSGQIRATLEALHPANIYPTTAATFTAPRMAYYLKNLTDFTPFPLKVSATTPVNEWATFAPWKAALKVYNKNPAAGE